MFEYIQAEHIEGSKKEKELMLISMSTCGFCKKAKSFLIDNDFAFSYIEADTVGVNNKAALKREFLEKFGQKVMYPCLIIDETEFLPAFIRVDWENTLL